MRTRYLMIEMLLVALVPLSVLGGIGLLVKNPGHQTACLFGTVAVAAVMGEVAFLFHQWAQHGEKLRQWRKNCAQLNDPRFEIVARGEPPLEQYVVFDYDYDQKSARLGPFSRHDWAVEALAELGFTPDMTFGDFYAPLPRPRFRPQLLPHRPKPC